MKIKTIITTITLPLVLSGCNNWLLEPVPGTSTVEDYFANNGVAVQSVNAAYAPLAWEFNSTYFSEWYIGDIVSDDALKGGQGVGDMADVFEMENFKPTSNSAFLLDYYRAQYQGVSRCNLAIENIPKMIPDGEILTPQLQKRLIAEAHFLRAMYYYRLVRIFGGVPKVDWVVQSSAEWKQPRASAADIYAFVIEDLEQANKGLWTKNDYPEADLGRASKGAAQAMLLKANLSIHNYVAAKEWGDSILISQQYDLMGNYADNFKLEHENGVESVFEIQYMEEPTSDYGEGYGFTRGTLGTIMMRSRSSLLGGGWGLNKPTQNLYNEFETADPRRDVTILNPTDAQIETPAQEIYLGCRYLNRKHMLMNDDGSLFSLAHPTRSPINTKVIRFADVLLMYAEACVEINDLSAAKTSLEQVRARARKNNPILPEFPNYMGFTDSKDDLRKAIRHERRVELAMEGHRWFDLCRWGVAKEVMDAYKATETPEARAYMAEFRQGVHELFPIPSKEIDLNPMEQNPGY